MKTHRSQVSQEVMFLVQMGQAGMHKGCSLHVRCMFARGITITDDPTISRSFVSTKPEAKLLWDAFSLRHGLSVFVHHNYRNQNPMLCVHL